MRRSQWPRDLMLAAICALAIGCQASHEREIYDRASGLRLALPAGWTQWDAEKLKSPEAVRVHLVAYAGDPEKKALVSVRRFPFRMPLATVAVTGDNVERLKPEDRGAFFDAIARQAEKSLAESTESWARLDTHYSESLPRGYFLTLVGQSREPGQAARWVKYVLVLPRRDEQILEVRFTVPVGEKLRYQADLDLLDRSLQEWIHGPAR